MSISALKQLVQTGEICSGLFVIKYPLTLKLINH